MSDRITIDLPGGERFESVGRLVLGGLASRFDLPVDRVDDLQLAFETLYRAAGAVTVHVDATAATDGLVVRVGPFADDPLADGGRMRVLAPLVDGVSAEAGDDGARWVELTVGAEQRPGGRG